MTSAIPLELGQRRKISLKFTVQYCTLPLRSEGREAGKLRRWTVRYLPSRAYLRDASNGGGRNEKLCVDIAADMIRLAIGSSKRGVL